MLLLCALLAAALLAPARAQTPSAVFQLSRLSGEDAPVLDFSRFEAAPPSEAAATGRLLPLGTLGAPIAVVPLPSIYNSVRATRSVFYANGKAVHVLGGRSDNDQGLMGWFLQLYPEQAADELYLNGFSLSRCILKPIGGSRPQINGVEFDLHIDISLTDPPSSKIIIAPRIPGAAKTVLTAGQVARDSYETGYPLRLGGREYRVLYGPDFTSEKGRFGGYNGRRTIMLMFPKGNGFQGYSFYEDDIPRDAVLVSRPDLQVPPSKLEPGDLTLGVRIDPAGNLEVYYPVP